MKTILLALSVLAAGCAADGDAAALDLAGTWSMSQTWNVNDCSGSMTLVDTDATHGAGHYRCDFASYYEEGDVTATLYDTSVTLVIDGNGWGSGSYTAIGTMSADGASMSGTIQSDVTWRATR